MGNIFITLYSPGPLFPFAIGGLSIRWYGLLIASAVLIGLNLSSRLSRFRGIKKGIINDLLPILVLSSIIGARAYYITFEWRNFSGVNLMSSINLLGISIPIPRALEIWSGGIAIHGALIGGAIGTFLFCRIKRQPFWDILDVLFPSMAFGQAIGRWGNFFNNEAFGLPTNLPWKLYIPYINRPNLYLKEQFFHPTFLYESIWNLCIFLMLIIIFFTGIRNLIYLPSGAISCIYLVSYSLGRLLIENLRIDPLCIASLPPSCSGGIRVAQLVSFILICIGSFGLVWIYSLKRKMPSLIKYKK